MVNDLAELETTELTFPEDAVMRIALALENRSFQSKGLLDNGLGIFGLPPNTQVDLESTTPFSVAYSTLQSRAMDTLESEGEFGEMTLEEALADPALVAEYPELLDLKDPSLRPETITVLEELGTATMANDMEAVLDCLEKNDLLATVDWPDADTARRIIEANSRGSLGGSMFGFGKNFYKRPLEIKPDNLQNGDIFLLSGPPGTGLFGGRFGHVNMVELDKFKTYNSNCLWTSNGEMKGIAKWEYATIDQATGQNRMGVYAEKMGKNAHEFAHVVLRPKDNSMAASAIAQAASMEGKPFELGGAVKYDGKNFYCSELVAYAWLPYVRIENAKSLNALDWVWPMDIYDAYTSPMGDYKWVVTYKRFFGKNIPVWSTYQFVESGPPTLSLVQQATHDDKEARWEIPQ